jgi:Icc-related predicted phosphoesterase
MTTAPRNGQPAVRIAAAGDLHLGPKAPSRFRNSFQAAARHADLLLVAGDLTASGDLAGVQLAVEDLRQLAVPVVAVPGNHDLAGRQPGRLVEMLSEAGVTVLHGTSTVIDVRGTRVGIAGTVGFGGGFAPYMVTAPGARQLKAFVQHSKHEAALLEAALGQTTDADVRVALTHYAPHTSTLAGEPPQLYPVLGCSRLGDVIDEADRQSGVAAAFHGHAHHGTEIGTTDGGVPVRNVAKPVLRSGHRIYLLHHTGGRWRLLDTANRPPPARTANRPGEQGGHPSPRATAGLSQRPRPAARDATAVDREDRESRHLP